MKTPTHSVASLLAYVSLGFAGKALTLPIISYLPPTYSQASGLSLAAIGVVFMLARLSDIVMDPLAGYLLDRTSLPWDRHKVWLLVSLPLLLLSIPPLFAPTHFSFIRTGGMPTAIAMLLVFYLGWTLLTITQTAWVTEIAGRAVDRTRVIAWREWAGVLGMLSIVFAPTVMENIGHGALVSQTAAMGVFAFFAVLISCTAAIGLVRSSASVGSRPTKLFFAYELAKKSANLRRILAADLLSGFGFAVFSCMSFFIFSRHLQLGAHFSNLMFAYMGGLIVGVPLTLAFNLKVGGPVACFRISMIGAAAAILGLFFSPAGDLLPAITLQFLAGIFTGGYQTNLNALMAEESVLRHDNDHFTSSGSHFALLALTNKIGYAVAIGISYPLLQFMGFSARAGENHATAYSNAALLWIGLAGTAIFLAAAGFCLKTRRDTRNGPVLAS